MIIDQIFCFFFCAKVISHQITYQQPYVAKTEEIQQEEDDPLSKSPERGIQTKLGSKRIAPPNSTGDPTNAQEEQKGVWKTKSPISGYVSTYTATYGGCLGCKQYFDEKGQLYYKMANGEKLDDNRLTIAFYDLGIMPLGTRVSLVNRTNGKSIVATITDTGGFMACCGRIADLSLATANAIGARTDIDLVEITEVSKVAEK